MSETAVFRDFTKKRRPIYFTLNDERYDARKALGVADLQDAVTNFKAASNEDDEITAETVIGKLSAALGILLMPEDHKRFIAVLMDRNAEEPIDMDQLRDIFMWLIEQYAIRPTEALSDSSTSSESVSAGTDSLVGAPQAVPTP